MKMNFLYGLMIVTFCSCNKTTFYVVRHAEKEAPALNMSTDVDLSPAGQQRAQALKEKLLGKVDFVTSTPTIRTRSTAQPLAAAMNKAVHVYDHKDTALLTRYRNDKVDILFVGHSNTVDDLVNFFGGKKILADLPDSAYGDLFIIKKKGKRFTFSRDRFGQ